MKTMKPLVAVAVAVAVAVGMGLSVITYAEAPVTITLGATQHVFDDNNDVDNEILPSAAIQYRFGQNWASELTYSVGEVDAVDGSQEVEIDSWHVGFLRYMQNQDSLHPYLAFGAGELIRDFDNGDAAETQFNVGGGLHYYFTDHWSWRADARWLHAPNDSTDDVAFSLGVSYSFAPPPGQVKPVEPVPVIDSDGDGVPDDMDECPDTPAGTRVDSRGCKLAVTQVASIKLKVNFAFDSDEVREHYFADIKDLAEFLKRFDDLQVDIEGHTDSVGPEAYNQGLSVRRANAVRELLINEYGIAAGRLEARGYGELRPMASNDSREGRAENRRVMATLEVEYED